MNSVVRIDFYNKDSIDSIYLTSNIIEYCKDGLIYFYDNIEGDIYKKVRYVIEVLDDKKINRIILNEKELNYNFEFYKKVFNVRLKADDEKRINFFKLNLL